MDLKYALFIWILKTPALTLANWISNLRMVESVSSTEFEVCYDAAIGYFGLFWIFSLPPNVELVWLLCNYIDMPWQAEMDSSVHRMKLNIMVDYRLNDFGKFFVICYWVLDITTKVFIPICKLTTMQLEIVTFLGWYFGKFFVICYWVLYHSGKISETLSPTENFKGLS